MPAEELVSELAEELALESEELSEPAAALPEFAVAPLVPPLGVSVCVPAVSGSQGLSGSGT